MGSYWRFGVSDICLIIALDLYKTSALLVSSIGDQNMVDQVDDKVNSTKIDA